MKLTNLQLGAACLLAAWAIFDFLESISRMGIYVPIGSYQGMDRWRSYQEENKELLSIIDQLKGSTASHSERKTTRETSDVIGLWIDLTWEDVATICLLLSLYLLFSSQITRPQVSPPELLCYTYAPMWGYEDRIQKKAPPKQAQEIAKRRRRIISKEDIERQFGRSLKQAAVELQVSVSKLKRDCRKYGIMRWQGPKGSDGTILEWFDGPISGPIDCSTKIDSIADALETPASHDSWIGDFSYMDFSTPSISKESEEVRGSCEKTVQVNDQSAMSTVYQTLNTLVLMEPQVGLTQMANENMGSSDDGRTSLVSQAQQDMCSVIIIKAIHGDTILQFWFHLASGIIGLKEEVSKRLEIGVDSFDVKYKDHEGDLISIPCDDDLILYLYVSRPLGNQAFKLFVISKTPNAVNVAG